MHFSATRPRERGFVLVTVGVCLVAMMAMLGLAIDIGRMYIVRNESQAYVDAASLTAALQLDGTDAGIRRATDTLSASTNQWDLGSRPFAGTQIGFGKTATDPDWPPSPNPAADYRFVRVQATSVVPLYFLPIVVSARSTVVGATAVAGQLPKTDFAEGVFPFSPFAHNDIYPNFGYTPGQQYTLRWPANPTLSNVCSGDAEQPWIDQSQLGGNSERGYIELESAEIIRMSILQDYQSAHVTVGQSVTMTGGSKQTELRSALILRVEQDTNPLATSYAQYESSGTGNTRRLVAVAINSGSPNNIVLGIGLFFLLADYSKGGNQPWCAEYVGPYVQGGGQQGAGGPGAYVVRLVQ
jgi:Flp pilus assembly protein TadG